jgi:hypothetical protein
MADTVDTTTVAATEAETTRIALGLTNGGRPALWEWGGGLTSTGHAGIVAGPTGERKPAAYIPRGGHLSNANHALIPVDIGDLVIVADHRRGDYTIAVSRIAAIDGDEGVLVSEHRFALGEWDRQPPMCILEAVDTAMAKAREYHCREPRYIAEVD